MSSHRVLKKAMQEQAFHAAYYFYGDDEFLKDAAVRQLVERAVDPTTRDFNLEIRRGGEIDAGSLGSLLATPPMMAERRVVVVRDVGALKKDARAALDRYLERPAPDTVVLLTSPAGAKADAALERTTLAVEYPLLTGDRVPKWIVHHATTELKVSITPEAAELLQSAAGNDLPQLASELDKLASYTSGGEIDEAAVSAVVGVRRGETLGDLLDCVGMHDAAKALALVPHVLAQPKASGVTIVMALSTQMLALMWGRAARDRGLAARALENEFFTLLRDTGSFSFRPWGDAARAWARAVDRWSADALDRALDALLAADRALKETRVSSEEQILATLVLDLCAEVSTRAA